jgi:hypothetical protein
MAEVGNARTDIGGWKKDDHSEQTFRPLFEIPLRKRQAANVSRGSKFRPSAAGMSFLNDTGPNSFKCQKAT